MGYHINEIPRGEYGFASKINEEYLEWEDAIEQKNPIMELVELSDLLGAIEAYTHKKYNLLLFDLWEMTKATKRAFEDGTRQPRV